MKIAWSLQLLRPCCVCVCVWVSERLPWFWMVPSGHPCLFSRTQVSKNGDRPLLFLFLPSIHTSICHASFPSIHHHPCAFPRCCRICLRPGLNRASHSRTALCSNMFYQAADITLRWQLKTSHSLFRSVCSHPLKSHLISPMCARVCLSASVYGGTSQSDTSQRVKFNYTRLTTAQMNAHCKYLANI